MRRSKNTHKIEMQPVLLHVAAENDKVYTPVELAIDIVNFFQPSGVCIDPCAGKNVFYDLLPVGSDWCEIERGRDFYAYTNHVDWAVSNPPYSHYSAWMRHSMKVANNIVYLMPAYKIFASGKFLDELFSWGGIVHIRRYGTGTQWGFPFGHALSAVHYQAGFSGSTSWSRYKGAATAEYCTCETWCPGIDSDLCGVCGQPPRPSGLCEKCGSPAWTHSARDHEFVRFLPPASKSKPASH